MSAPRSIAVPIRSRKHRLLTALLALLGMLFMQFAVAAYACPRLQAGNADGPSMSPHAADQAPGMPDCGEPDADSPALCHAHCHDGQSSLDKPEARTPAPVFVTLMVLPAAFEPAVPRRGPPAEAPSLLRRPTAPPIAIRHCCYRI